MTKPGARGGGTTKFLGKGQELRHTQRIGTIFAITLHFLDSIKLKVIVHPAFLEAPKIGGHVCEFTFWIGG